HMDDEWVQKNMSIVGLRLKRDLSGVETLDLEEMQPKKNIATTRSFDVMVDKFEDLKQRVINFASICGEKLRKQQSHCKSMQVFVMTNPFLENQQQYAKSIHIDLPFATNSSL